MTADKPTPVVPNLRFPEFGDTPWWAPTKLNDLLDYEQPGKYIVEASSYQDTGTPVLTANKSFVLGHTAETDGIYDRVPVIIFDDFTTDAKYVDFPFKVKSSAIKILTCRSDVHLKLVYELMSRISFDPTQHKRYYISQYQYQDIPLPGKAEQQKIADCLGSLDDLIAAEGRKLEALRQHKQGLMQQLLPQEGNARPAVRFSQYRDAEAWNVTRLGDIADYENGKAYEKDIVDNGRFVVVNARFISTDGAVRKYTNETYCIAQTSDVLMVLSDLPSARALARCFFVDADDTYAVNQRVAKLRSRSVDSRFLLYALDQHPWLMAFSDGINQTHLSKGSVLDCPMAAPRDDGEQKLIGECLGAVDSLVTAQEAKLAALTRHKNGLLQQLFPSPEEESR